MNSKPRVQPGSPLLTLRSNSQLRAPGHLTPSCRGVHPSPQRARVSTLKEAPGRFRVGLTGPPSLVDFRGISVQGGVMETGRRGQAGISSCHQGTAAIRELAAAPPGSAREEPIHSVDSEQEAVVADRPPPNNGHACGRQARLSDSQHDQPGLPGGSPGGSCLTPEGPRDQVRPAVGSSLVSKPARTRGRPAHPREEKPSPQVRVNLSGLGLCPVAVLWPGGWGRNACLTRPLSPRVESL